MKQITLYITAFALIGLSVAACQNENLLTGSDNDGVTEIKMKPELSETKTLIDVTSDDIYAHTYGNSDVMATEALRQVGIENGVYSYSVPEGTETVIFSNHASSDDFAVTKTAEGGLQFTRKADASMYDTDIVAGAASMSGIDSEGTLSPHLSRLNSFITADLYMKSIDGTDLDLSDYMTYAYLRLPNQAGNVTYNADGSISVSGNTFDGIVPDDPTEEETVPVQTKYYMAVGDTLATAFGDAEYGYLLPTVGYENATEANIWTFTETEGGYTIADCYGRYLYKTGTYDSFSVSTTMPTEGHVWTITEMEDGTHKIFNTTQGSWIQYKTEYKDFSGATSDKGIRPTLIPVVDYYSTEMQARQQMAASYPSVSEGQTSYALAAEMATLPTAMDRNSRLEVVIGNKSGTEMVVSKDLEYPFEPNRHYFFTLVVKRNETGFGFYIEEIIEEEINIDLN
ncbi:MAG: hypothetical protein IJ394_07750 [Bacteroidales bacterium]|nr:hypothetical protein [Bacteroidales bacterium]